MIVQIAGMMLPGVVIFMSLVALRGLARRVFGREIFDLTLAPRPGWPVVPGTAAARHSSLRALRDLGGWAVLLACAALGWAGLCWVFYLLRFLPEAFAGPLGTVPGFTAWLTELWPFSMLAWR